MTPQPARLRITTDDAPTASWGVIAVSLLAAAAFIFLKAHLAAWVWSRFVATHFGVPALPASAVMGVLLIVSIVRTFPKSDEPPTWDRVRRAVSQEAGQLVMAAGLALALLPFAG